MAFSDNRCPRCLDCNPHFGDIDGYEGATVLPRKDTTGVNRFSAPAIEPENPVGLRDREPALDIGELAAIGLARADLAAVEISPQGLYLALLKSPSPHPYAQNRLRIGEGNAFDSAPPLSSLSSSCRFSLGALGCQ